MTNRDDETAGVLEIVERVEVMMLCWQ